MAANNDKGKAGEELAKLYFEKAGYQVVHQNWRYRHWEIDLIASKKNILHFVEVKWRSSNKYGYPEESVSRGKIRNLLDAAAEFQYQFPEWKRVQFDVLAITEPRDAEPEYLLLEDVYL